MKTAHLILLFANAALLGCSKAPTGDQVKPDLSTNTQEVKSTNNPLLTEALAQTEPLLSTKWYNEGDSWFTLNQYGGSAIVRSPLYIQARKVTYDYRPGMLSDADKLNGIEWRGDILYRYNLYRTFDPATSKWSNWNDGSLFNSNMPEFSLVRKRGQWEINGGNPDIYEKPSAKTISTLPK